MMISTYLIYLALSLGITYWVGQTLHRNGRVFLIENFEGQESLADSINHLLLVGFYLVNVGFVSLALRYGTGPAEEFHLNKRVAPKYLRHEIRCIFRETGARISAIGARCPRTEETPRRFR